MDKENKRIIIVLISFCLVFVSLIGYLSYFQVFKANRIKENSYNKRLWINEENTLRGSILDRNGKILVYSDKESNKRFYKYGNLYSHVIGYSYREYGKTGLELYYNNALLNIDENTAINEIKNLVIKNNIGNDIRLTIDHSLQEKSRNLLKGKKGSIITMNPKTGEIYSMISLPDFDTDNLREDWKNIVESSDSPLFNRATQGLYPPGSIFKLISATAILKDTDFNRDYTCTGEKKIDGYVFSDYNKKAHGEIDLKDAIVKSCNTYFAEKSILIGKDNLGKFAEGFLINKSIDFSLPVKKSVFNYKKSLGKTQIAASSIGQGEVLVTPLNMLLMSSAIANNGQMAKPILVNEIINKNGKVVEKIETEIIANSVNSIIANELKEMMVEVVKSGTGKRASIKNVKVAGKTGTAQNASKKDHGWFIGFAPADDPKVSVVVMLEEEGNTGGTVAAPIARELIIHALNNIKF